MGYKGDVMEGIGSTGRKAINWYQYKALAVGLIDNLLYDMIPSLCLRRAMLFSTFRTAVRVSLSTIHAS